MKGEQEDYEVDLGIITKDRIMRSKEVIPMFCECKSFGSKPRYGLTEKSINNILRICSKFPYSIAVFAVLRDDLTPREKGLLKKKILSNYKKRAKRRSYTDIVILTGTELLSTEHLQEIWTKGTAEHKKYSGRADWCTLEELAKNTCSIYLGTKGFYNWYENTVRTKIDKPR